MSIYDLYLVMGGVNIIMNKRSDKGIILFMGEMVLPEGNAPAQRTMSLCKSARDLGYTPVLIGLTEWSYPKKDILSTLNVYNGFDCYLQPYPVKISQWVERMFSIKDAIKVINHYGVENVKAIVITDYDFIALYKLMRYCRKNNIRIIGDCVDWYTKSNQKFPLNICKDIDTFMRMRVIYPKMDYMIAIGTFLEEHYKKSIYNVVKIPVTVDKNDEKWKLENENSDDNILTVGYAGNPGIHLSKERIDYLIKAACELNSEGFKIKLKLSGFEESNYEQELLPLKKLPFYNETVEFHGRLPHKDCLKFIAKCDVSAIVREDNIATRAGFPTKLGESLMCGVPVISTPTMSVCEYIKDGCNGFLSEDFTYDSFKSTLRRVAGLDRNILNEIKRNAKEDMCLTYEKFTDAFEEIIS